ncbi:unnamed protein product, partial [marine sediment metagenome]
KGDTMKLEKAIEILTEDINHPTAKFTPDLVDAEKLGIEALRRLERERKHGRAGVWTRLPGETRG